MAHAMYMPLWSMDVIVSFFMFFCLLCYQLYLFLSFLFGAAVLADGVWRGAFRLPPQCDTVQN